MRNKLTAVAAAGMLSLCSIAPGFAASVTQPGETVGIATGAPLPPGFYFVNTLDYGCRDTEPDNTCLGITIPVVAWSTPWTILGARLQFLYGHPALEVGVANGGPYEASFYNPVFLGQLAWDLGGGWGVSYAFGAYFDVHERLAWSSTDPQHRLAVSYTGGGWNITANAIYMTFLDQVTNRPQLSPCPAPFGANGCNPESVNLDLTFTKKYGKWEFGPIAYATWDLDKPIPTYRQQSLWAIGGLVGYSWGDITLQGFYSQELDQDNRGGIDHRLWTRVIINLGNPFPTAPASKRY